MRYSTTQRGTIVDSNRVYEDCKTVLKGAIDGSVGNSEVSATYNAVLPHYEQLNVAGELSNQAVKAVRLVKLLSGDWTLLKDGAFLDKVRTL